MIRANRSRKLRKDWHPCGCCYTWEPVRARARQADRDEVEAQLAEVPSLEERLAEWEDANPNRGAEEGSGVALNAAKP